MLLTQKKKKGKAHPTPESGLFLYFLFSSFSRLIQTKVPKMGDLKISSKPEKNLGELALSGSKYEDAADLFDKDVNCFKLADSC